MLGFVRSRLARSVEFVLEGSEGLNHWEPIAIDSIETFEIGNDMERVRVWPKIDDGELPQCTFYRIRLSYDGVH